MVFVLKVYEHGEGLFPLLKNRDVVRHGRLQFKGCRPRIGDVDNDEVGQVTQRPHRLAEVLGLGLVEVKHHRHEAEVAEFVSQPLQDNKVRLDQGRSAEVRPPLRSAPLKSVL
jgi:hypothetical protein